MKKIAFIEPKAPNLHVFSKFKLPRLGSLILATSLKKLGHEVRIFFEDAGRIDYRFIDKSDLVCISTITSTTPRAYEISAYARGRDIPVIMGGPHVTFNHMEALKHSDYVLRGEADLSMVNFIEAFENGSGFEKVPGIAYYDHGALVENNLLNPPSNLDKIPFPDFDLMQGYDFFDIAPVITSRGCPNNCSFCNVPLMFGRKVRFRSEENVIEELKSIKRKWVFFYDDNFTANVERTRNLIHLMRKNDIRKKWIIQATIEAAKDDKLLKEMNAAGLKLACIGFESINQNVLKTYNKRQSVLKMHEYVKRFHKAGISIHGMFIFGSDADTKDDMKATVAFCKELGLKSIQFLILTPLPGTAFFNNLVETGRILYRDWKLYDGHHTVFLPKNFSALNLQKETIKMMTKFYSWKQIIKNTFKFRLPSAYMGFSAKRLIKKWKRNKENKSFIKELKNLCLGKKLPSFGENR